ncbi:hypothetical protein HRbin26_01741 [bacterium HR26]|nr:hypothetical protein HRbin26_01741 [bacterium HR26]
MRPGRRTRRTLRPMLVLAIAMLLGACSLAESATTGSTEATPTEAVAETSEPPRLENFDPALFDESSTTINNQWWPLTPGTQFVYEGTSVENEEKIEHRLIVTVTDLTKEIAGVRTLVIMEQDYQNDRLVEAELAFFAQDRDGNVWHFGQYRETYDETEFVGGRVFVQGIPEGARAGIMVQADPRPNTPDYSQGYGPPPYNWTDRARVAELGAKASVAYGSFDDVLVIEEFNAEEPGAFQLKYYARGVGLVQVGWRGNDPNQEELELVDVVKLEGDALAEARDKALELEKRAYLYASTPPVEVLKTGN